MTTFDITSKDAAGNVTGYNVLLYVDGMEDHTPQGMRMCKLTWKANTSENKPALSVPRCVFIPLIPLQVTPVELLSAMRDALNDIQDKQIRSFVENDLRANVAVKPIAVSAMLPASMSAKYAEDNASTTRLNKESIQAWFNASVKDKLTLAFIAKQGLDMATMTEADLAPFEAASVQHCGIFEKFASPGFTVQPQRAIQLTKVLDLADNQSAPIVNSLRTKLLKMQVVEPLTTFDL